MAGDDKEVKDAAPGPVNAVALKLPPFWPADPELWIAQVEAQFRTRNITKDDTKYDHVVASLSPDTAGEIREVLLNPPETEKYAAIKAALLKRNELSDQKRLQELLSKEDLGDRRPTQILRRMRQLVGETVLDAKLLHTLFFQKLPHTVQQIMVTAGDEVALEDMAEMADRILDVTTPQVNKITVPNQTTSVSEISMLRDEVRELKKMIKNMGVTKSGSHSQQRSSSRGRSPYRKQRDINRHPLCWYHHKFGDKSTKCEHPCEWSASGNGVSSPPT